MYNFLRIWFIVGNIIYLPLLWLLSLIRYKKPPSIPPITNSLLTISATELAKKIIERKCTSYEVVSAYIEQIKKVNPYINAVVDDRNEEALAEAKGCDALLEAGCVDIVTLAKQKPLYGVPFTIKECCPVKGLSYTGCSLLNKGLKAADDSDFVKILRDAGAIPLCVTNTPEMCCSADTSNFLYGSTRNPYDTRYSCGGSTGGEAALLGSGASLIGIGSDFGGSIRIPALFCGVFGLKPTPRIIPTKDHFPNNVEENYFDFLTFGPMARYADDISLLMKVASKKSTIDLHLNEPVDLKQTRVYYSQNIGKSPGIMPMSPEFEECVLKAADYFTKRGVYTEEIPIKWPTFLPEMIMLMYTKFRISNIPIDVKRQRPISNPTVEIIKSLFGLSQYTMSTLNLAFLTQCSNKLWKRVAPKKESLRRSVSKFKEFQQQLQDLLGENGLLIYPTFRVTAPFPEVVFLEVGSSVPYCALANVIGFPSVQVPMGLNSKGMPIGLQIIAAPYQERLCLAAAKELETAFGGWVPPSISIKS